MGSPSLTSQIVARRELGSAGASGNVLELVTLRDGRELVLKRVSPEWDWLTRASNDDGRIVRMWDEGLFDRIPAAIDHATVAVEEDEGGGSWSVFMTDVSPSLVRNGQRLDRAAVQRVLAAAAALHDAFWGESFPQLCGLEDRYLLLSPRTGEREKQLGNDLIGDGMPACWQAFYDNVPKDIGDAIAAILEQPRLLTEQLDKCTQTLVHGDIRLNNLGFSGDRVVLVDWGERTGAAPPAVELASFLIFDGRRLDVSREQVIDDFRRLYGDRFEERALQLALIGGVVQLGSTFAVEMLSGDEAQYAEVLDELAWWSRTVETALETWSPI
jgi:hypothetical protein